MWIVKIHLKSQYAINIGKIKSFWNVLRFTMYKPYLRYPRVLYEYRVTMTTMYLTLMCICIMHWINHINRPLAIGYHYPLPIRFYRFISITLTTEHCTKYVYTYMLYVWPDASSPDIACPVCRTFFKIGTLSFSVSVLCLHPGLSTIPYLSLDRNIVISFLLIVRINFRMLIEIL